MTSQKRLVFHTGGPVLHPTADQAKVLAEWLGPGVECDIRDGNDTFEALDNCDLLVLMGLFWEGMTTDHFGNLPYHPPLEKHRQAFAAYVQSGKPLLVHHGATCCYGDWPGFDDLLGFSWVWGVTYHPPRHDFAVRVLPTGHPVMEGISDYSLWDEIYCNMRISPKLETTTHAVTTWDGQEEPMVVTAERESVAGCRPRIVYLANGHNLRAYECPAIKQLFLNSVRWLLEE